ncbi:MAG: EF-hand domain-containing protein [Polaromonas sp.]
MMLTVSAAAALFALSAQAQNAAASAPAPSQAASQPATAASAAETPPPAPRYSAPELERAFNFMDGNHDGKLSREEASGFRGVAKHFDQADTNKDNFLSPEEFDKAMNYVKPK